MARRSVEARVASFVDAANFVVIARPGTTLDAATARKAIGKLGVGNRVQALARASELGLIRIG